MSVYVDELRLSAPYVSKDASQQTKRVFGRKGQQACHMAGDNLDELHAFALRIGLKRAWFHDHPLIPHYDLTAPRRAHAVRLGAIEISTRKLLEMKKR